MKTKQSAPEVFIKINERKSDGNSKLHINFDAVVLRDGIPTANIASFARYEKQTSELPSSLTGVEKGINLVFKYVQGTRGKLLAWADGGEDNPSVYDIFPEGYEEAFKGQITKVLTQEFSEKEMDLEEEIGELEESNRLKDKQIEALQAGIQTEDIIEAVTELENKQTSALVQQQAAQQDELLEALKAIGAGQIQISDEKLDKETKQLKKDIALRDAQIRDLQLKLRGYGSETDIVVQEDQKENYSSSSEAELSNTAEAKLATGFLAARLVKEGKNILHVKKGEKLFIEKGLHTFYGDIHIDEGAELHILPGTMIMFFHGGIVCKGTLVAIGLAHAPIIFQCSFSERTDKVVPWNNITFFGNANNQLLLKNLVIRGSLGRRGIIPGNSKEMLLMTEYFGGGSGEHHGGGICLIDAQNAQIENVVMEDCGRGCNRGGAIYLHRSGVTILNCTLENNSADLGEGIYIDSTSNPKIAGTIITKNRTRDRDSGGICIEKRAPQSSNIVITKSEVSSYPSDGIKFADQSDKEKLVLIQSDVSCDKKGE